MTISKLIDSLFLIRESGALTLQEAEAIAAKLRAAEELANEVEAYILPLPKDEPHPLIEPFNNYRKAGETK